MAKISTQVYYPILLRWEPIINILTDVEAGVLLKAMYQYQINGKKPNFAENDRLAIFWCDVENWLDTAAEKYNDKIKQASEAGKKSAKARKRLTNVNEPEQPLTISISNQKEKEKEKDISISNETEQADIDELAEEKPENELNEEERVIGYFKDLFKSYTNNDLEIIGYLYRRYGAAKVEAAISAGRMYNARSAAYVKKILENAKDGEIDLYFLAKAHNNKHAKMRYC